MEEATLQGMLDSLKSIIKNDKVTMTSEEFAVYFKEQVNKSQSDSLENRVLRLEALEKNLKSIISKFEGDVEIPSTLEIVMFVDGGQVQSTSETTEPLSSSSDASSFSSNGDQESDAGVGVAPSGQLAPESNPSGSIVDPATINELFKSASDTDKQNFFKSISEITRTLDALNSKASSKDSSDKQPLWPLDLNVEDSDRVNFGVDYGSLSADNVDTEVMFTLG